jgi:hypothetical protein
VHYVQDAALDGLETVAGVGQSAGGDDGKRVIEVSAASFRAQRHIGDVVAVITVRAIPFGEGRCPLGRAAGIRGTVLTLWD